MKKSYLIILCFLLPTSHLIAQEKPQQEPNPVIITTYEYDPLPPGDTTFKGVNLDSLVMYYMDKGILPNNMILNHRILVHAWGADSYKIIFIYEIEKFENINKAAAKTTELIDASFKNEADKKKFWKLWGLLFDRHDDSIMTDWGKSKR
jgi:hypothetical protein